MRRLFIFVVLALLGFYVVWPAVSAWQIKSALASGDAAALSRKIDFDRIRLGLRPIILKKVEERIAEAGRGAGGGLAGAIGKGLAPQIADEAAKRLVTPETLIRIARSGGSLAATIEAIVAEQAGKLGGLGGLSAIGSGNGGLKIPGGLGNVAGGSAGLGALAGKFGLGSKSDGETAPVAPPVSTAARPADTSGAASSAPSYGLSNIKRFGFDGPLAFQVGLAKDLKAVEPDVSATIAFSGFDWKVVEIRPKL